ncbi:response regulator [Peribacillus asahii]|uniref:response regulator n=1 Tax=Peribacillus asahii TaxID=228899 RepID=UPI0020795275|nr:response regulator [Peribacillus asahii]USK59610.1 response regulator [Peribacillus asahii]
MKKSVLLVDDSLFMRTLLKRELNPNYFTVISEAEDGLEAIEKYKMLSPDIVLMDVTMPKVNGIEALKEIICFDQCAKVVMCSALGSQPLVIEALKAGAKDYIVKPRFGNLNNTLINLY